MNARRAERCSFLSSGPGRGGISLLGSRLRNISEPTRSTINNLSWSSYSEVDSLPKLAKCSTASYKVERIELDTTVEAISATSVRSRVFDEQGCA
jgi:hypothetical protein